VEVPSGALISTDPGNQDVTRIYLDSARNRLILTIVRLRQDYPLPEGPAEPFLPY
jgi:hypothetical protein